MTAHTPGPWSTGKGYGLHGVEIVGADGNRIVCGVIGVDRDKRDPDGRIVGSTPCPEGWANARLIAAAPDLLAALLVAEKYVAEHMRAFREDCTHPDGSVPDAGDRDFIEQDAAELALIRTAILKATQP